MASPPPTGDHSSYSDKQIASNIDHGKEVVPQTQPYPDAYAFANPNNTNNDSTNGGSGGGGLEAADQLLTDAPENPAWSKQSSKRKFCGLSRRALIIVLAVATALIVAAIIGGSIGGVLANKNKSDSASADSAKTSSTSSATAIPTAVATTSASASTATSEPATSTTTRSSSLSTSTSTTSTASASTATTTGEGSYNCPADNNTNYVSPLFTDATWTILCDTDWPSGVAALSGGSVVDLTAVIAYSIDECIDQCAANNIAGDGCQAVVYGANITLALSRGGIQGNCFLKNDRGAENSVDNSGQVEAAYLLLDS
ncbi:uncharacterized protein Z520_04193 [Fonsecaea multimorphosa CBS 102226]|uniref:Apple domain-containing protein n=1 Tax=Fonsecaea multimorphosa CBS 102226 TaxID=1442371 RepID=A0A0D2K3X8_9EURO|nr:uncharacterized protein Z520_04193 [Fonsecaea multimorphosa CBS 102226]KIY00508.1 hypothetical protein Z520_04193 [Fonsecaea multimorphosa CBS 102226]